MAKIAYDANKKIKIKITYYYIFFPDNHGYGIQKDSIGIGFSIDNVFDNLDRKINIISINNFNIPRLMLNECHCI